jgi:hypothetical protein
VAKSIPVSRRMDFFKAIEDLVLDGVAEGQVAAQDLEACRTPRETIHALPANRDGFLIWAKLQGPTSPALWPAGRSGIGP